MIHGPGASMGTTAEHARPQLSNPGLLPVHVALGLVAVHPVPAAILSTVATQVLLHASIPGVKPSQVRAALKAAHVPSSFGCSEQSPQLSVPVANAPQTRVPVQVPRGVAGTLQAPHKLWPVEVPPEPQAASTSMMHGPASNLVTVAVQSRLQESLPAVVPLQVGLESIGVHPMTAVTATVARQVRPLH